MRVQHRHIIYVQGYDPRGLAQYYRMFRTELRKFGRLYQLTATISRPQSVADGEIASWTIETKADDWQTRTDYDFLRFEDFIQRDLAPPIWRMVFHAIWIYWRLIFAGTIGRFCRRTGGSPPSSPSRISCCCSRRSALGGSPSCFEKGLDALGVPDLFSIAAAAVVSSPLLGTVLKYTEKSTYRALSAVRHDLDLGILAPPAAGMGPAHRPLCAASRQRRAAPATPRRSSRRPQFGIVPRHRNPGARAEARSRRSAGMARASCC